MADAALFTNYTPLRCLAGVVSLLVVAGCILGCTTLAKVANPEVCSRFYAVGGAFPANETAGVMNANSRWNAFGDEQFCVILNTERDEHAIRRMHYGSPEWQEVSRRFNGLNVIGLYEKGPDRITIVDGLSENDFLLVALHEFGHARGLKHIPAPAIMHASIGTAQDFTSNDRAECQRVDACPGASVMVLVVEDEEGCVLVLPKATG